MVTVRTGRAWRIVGVLLVAASDGRGDEGGRYDPKHGHWRSLPCGVDRRSGACEGRSDRPDLPMRVPLDMHCIVQYSDMHLWSAIRKTHGISKRPKCRTGIPRARRGGSREAIVEAAQRLFLSEASAR